MALTGPDLPKVPIPLKSIQPYLTVATKHDQRDSVVSYWCRLYALQTGLKLSTKTSEETTLLMKLMDWLEATKKQLHDNEAITNDVAAQAHIENWALKLFLYADKNDRAANFSKNVLQSFYTAQILYDVLTLFGELSVEATQNRKYAQWKAAYIHNCQINGETPVPGPMKEQDDESNTVNTSSIDNDGEPKSNVEPESPKDNIFPSVPSIPASPPAAKTQSFESEDDMYKTESGTNLSVEQIGKAQKFIKWASSALDYDDIATSVMNLRNALHLLTTGQEPV
ncbi:vacuolar protein sorting-associated protein VTA1 homolog [Monomorium pharaonis]|uniref:vacuolar protein sorting-associated protein VTA1 homolog n=1 Tax=Monomorium pharaonis TaxID=307658 RepID=UPI00063F2134|nr:vacuolar protein sorting-associated protein VTA1 homolog [Monomorium pharaonis]